MDPIKIQQPPPDIDTKYLLEPLINELKCKWYKTEKEIAEIRFLKSFPSYETVFPQSKFSPRRVIEYMRAQHATCGFQMKNNPHFYREITYNYYDHNTSEVNSFTFCNNMSFVADIFTICYLYHIQQRTKTFTLEIIYNIYNILVDKYDIKLDYIRPYDAITGLIITQSFPSVSFRWFGYEPDDTDKSINSSSHFTLTMFPGITKILWSPIIASIIPKFKKKSKFVPIALLTALYVKTEDIVKDYLRNKMNYHDYVELSLDAIFKHINALYDSKVFPNSLRLKLGKEWGIVKKVGREYKYADYFNTNFEQAINIIRDVKSQDPDCEAIISLLRREFS